MAMLIIRQGFNSGAAFRLGQRTLTIGRHAGNLVQLIDDKVSRRHALIRWTGSGYHIQDLTSANGILVNTERVFDTELHMGDKVTIGKTVLEVVQDAAGLNDQTLGRKVVDQQIIGGETQAVTVEEAFSKPVTAGETMDIDKEHAQRDLRLSMFLYDLSSAAHGSSLKDAFQKVITGIGEYIGPDRSIAFQMSPEGKALPLATGYADGLDLSEKKVRPNVHSIRAAFKNKRPVILNDLPRDPGDRYALGSAAVMPVLNSKGALVALFYLDTFADNRQHFLESDLEFLKLLADKVKSKFD
jgi:hypothetical protein